MSHSTPLIIQLKQACFLNDLIELKKLLQEDVSQEDLNEVFQMACIYGHLEQVRYLLTSPELSKHADIAYNDYTGLRCASEQCYVDIICYLIESPELTHHADVHVGNDYIYKEACDVIHVETLEYLLSLRHDRAINFQNTIYNLDWAMKQAGTVFSEESFRIVIAMMRSLEAQDIVQYYEWLPRVQWYCSRYNKMELYQALVNTDSPQEIPLYIS